MSTGSVLLDVSVVHDHDLMRITFGSFEARPSRCPHDITSRYFARVSDDQWKYVGRKADRLILLQAFIFADTLDVSLEGGGLLPAPEGRVPSSLGCPRMIELSLERSQDGHR